MEHIERAAQVFKALGDPIRIKLLKILSKQDLTPKYCVCEIANRLEISQPNVSHHIKILKHSGILSCKKCDGCSYYVINKEAISDLTSLLNCVLKSSEKEKNTGNENK